MSTITDELLTRADLMKLFKVSQPAILRLEAAGKLQPIRIGSRVRFKRADVEVFLSR
ncbi:MAG: helix-turn-helix domain-containing protein [Candidatus Sulfotelmatobacter sp.]|jgi:excisionase family DNA binding protein